MNACITKRNELLAQKVIKGLESRNMSGYYAPDRQAALELALSLIPAGSTATMGGGMSVHEIGLVEALKKGNYTFIDRDAASDKRAAMLAAYDADVFLASCNAITDEQGLQRRGRGAQAGAERRRADQRPALWALHALCQDRLLPRLQIAGHDLLPVSDHALLAP